MIVGAGQLGCGFEATLEAWYRFLIDPEPYLTIRQSGNFAVLEGIDQKLLAQRAAFLRPDSAVAVVMLSDENDCSIREGGVYFLAGMSLINQTQEFRLPRATSSCATDPNGVCCRSCGLAEAMPPAGCSPLMSDPGCAQSIHDRLGDSLNLRCFDQKRRFGIDFLYPLERYATGLSSAQIENRSGALVQNPLFSDLRGGGAPQRDPSLVTLAAIVGVPWQDLARDPSNSSELMYMSASELARQGRWAVVAGDPQAHVPPTDPFARESVDPRSGTNPVTGDSISPPTATGLSNPINGHDYTIPERTDLQYTCIFPLNTPRECVGNPPPPGCDCTEPSQRPVCEGTIQRYAKAYPSTRQLALLSKLGSSAVAASICARNMNDPSRQDFAYAPAVQAIIERLRVILK